MSDGLITDIDFSIDFGESFRCAVADGKSDPYVGIRIRAGETYLYGSGERTPTNWATYLINSFLEAMESVVTGERAVVTDHDGPSYFIFDPEGDQAVQVAHVFTRDAIEDPDRQGSLASTAKVNRQALLETLTLTAEELRDRIEAENPDLRSTEDFSRLDSNIAEARSTLETNQSQ